jgi:hypothetical protein
MSQLIAAAAIGANVGVGAGVTLGVGVSTGVGAGVSSGGFSAQPAKNPINTTAAITAITNFLSIFTSYLHCPPSLKRFSFFFALSDNFLRMERVRRNWKGYNEQLVRRGEILLDLDFLRSWNKELEEMNRDKLGRPYEYPASYSRFLSMIYLLPLSAPLSAVGRLY